LVETIFAILVGGLSQVVLLFRRLDVDGASVVILCTEVAELNVGELFPVKTRFTARTAVVVGDGHILTALSWQLKTGCG